MQNELSDIHAEWEEITEGTLALLRALPAEHYDFRPDPGGRSIGELAWHLAEIDGYLSTFISRGEFRTDLKPPNITRPKTVDALAPGFARVHDDAVARLATLQPSDLDREIPYIDGTPWTIRRLLRRKLLAHAVHHRGQLMTLCRLAGGVPPPLFGRRREETLALK